MLYLKAKKLNSLETTVKEYFKKKKTLTRDEFINLIKNDYPSWSTNTINAYLYRLKKEKIIKNPQRGVYTQDTVQSFSPLISTQLKEIASLISNKLPFTDYCISNTLWLNDLMTHQPFKTFIVVEIEKVAIEQVFTILSYEFRNVFLNPDRLIFSRYIDNIISEDIIIVKNLNTESPTLTIDGIKTPSLEKILVDILIEENLYSAQQGELDYIFKSAYKKFTINEAKMKRYASRRNREIELKKRMNTILAK